MRCQVLWYSKADIVTYRYGFRILTYQQKLYLKNKFTMIIFHLCMSAHITMK